MRLFDIFFPAAFAAAAFMQVFAAWSGFGKKAKAYPAPPVPPVPMTPPFPSPRAASPDSAARPDWRVYAVDRNDNCFTGSGIVLEKEQDEFIMGRGEGCDLKLMLPQIGRRHARVTRRGAVYIYQDLGSKAGSVCRGEKIESKPLEHMMVVMVCDVALVFVNGAARQEHVLSAVRNAHV